MKDRKPLFSLTKNDFDVSTFKAGGKGGQYQNKTKSGVRIVHRKSGAVGEARDCRDQHTNRENAFRRMASSPNFQAWLKTETARQLGKLAQIDEAVKEAMRPENLRIETQVNGKWKEVGNEA